jgi:hypothetical protein
MSPKARGDYKPPRERREIVTAVLVAVAIVVATGVLVWFVRPNQNSGSSGTTVTTSSSATSTTVAGATTSSTTPADTTAPATSAP